METSNLSLAYLVAELKPLVEGAFLNSVQQASEQVFKIKVHSKEHGTIDLLATPNALFKTSYKLQAQMQQTGFAAFLKKRLYNKRILSLEQHGFDRIIEMRFAECDLVFELFAKGNIILKDKSEKIISCYRTEEWKDRKLARNEQYKFPATKPSILEASAQDFEKTLNASAQDCVRAIVTAFNVAPIAAEEACDLANIKKEKKSAGLSKAEIEKIFTALKELYSLAIKQSPIVAETADGTQQLLPFSFKTIAAACEKKFLSLSEALDENSAGALLSKDQKQVNSEQEKKKARLQYSQKEQLKAKERLEKDAVENKKKAELVYANFVGIKELVGAINSAIGKKLDKKDIMYKIKIAGEKGNQSAKLLVDFDPKTKKLVLDLPDK